MNLAILDGNGADRPRCKCGSRARWSQDHGDAHLCNGCLIRELQALYTAATGYVVRQPSLPIEADR